MVDLLKLWGAPIKALTIPAFRLLKVLTRYRSTENLLLRAGCRNLCSVAVLKENAKGERPERIGKEIRRIQKRVH